MKFAISAALLAALAAPVCSLSYLESLGTSAPPAQGLSKPGLKPPPVAANAGMGSYLDAFPQTDTANAPPAPAGMTSYSDALASQAPPAPPAPPAASYAPPTPPVVGSSTSYTPAPAAQVPAGGNYLEALAKTTSSAAPSGAGIGSYLDALPKNNQVGGSRAGAAPAKKKSYAPFVASAPGNGLSELSYSAFHSDHGRTFVGKTATIPPNTMAPDNFVGLVGPSPDTSISLLHQLQNHVGVIRLGGVLPKKTSYGTAWHYGLGL